MKKIIMAISLLLLTGCTPEDEPFFGCKPVEYYVTVSFWTGTRAISPTSSGADFARSLIGNNESMYVRKMCP